MMTFSIFNIVLIALASNLLISGLVWAVSAVQGNLALADRVWSLLILLSAVIFAVLLPPMSSQLIAMLVICVLWALRLSLFIMKRSWGQPEDRRYAEMRARHQPTFIWTSLYKVFELQAVLAWLIAMPFLAVATAHTRSSTWSWLDYLGLGLATFGVIFEAYADAQMAAFKAKASEKSSVMQAGLWRYSRHPNYFGESCVWWGFGLVAVSAGGWWALLSPILITFLLLRVSGINLQEKDVASRSVAYASYVRRTSSFVPWPPISNKSQVKRIKVR
jgi:steroid 5-alpha reductase family enzyme